MGGYEQAKPGIRDSPTVRQEIEVTSPDRVVVALQVGSSVAATGNFMGTLNRQELDHLERRELQLTILAAVFVLVLAGGLAAFMYPLVFLHPLGNKWTLRVAFFGFCGLTLLFVGYELERNVTFNNKRAWICCTPCPI